MIPTTSPTSTHYWLSSVFVFVYSNPKKCMQSCSCLTSDSNTYVVFFSAMCICIVCSISKKCMPFLLNLASPLYVCSISKKCMGDGLEIFNATCLCFYILSILFQRNVSCPSFSAVLFLLDTGFEFLMPAKSPLHILAAKHRHLRLHHR